MKQVVIVGGGLSGLSAAIELVDAGWEVTVLEKKNFLGGRASNIIDKKMGDPVPIGPHILLSSYKRYQRFLKKIGTYDAVVWADTFIDIVYDGTKHHIVKNSNLPTLLYVAWWTLIIPFLTLREKLSGTRFGIAVLFASQKKVEQWDQVTALELLHRYGVAQGSIDRFWRFFALSMLNVPLEDCSAASFVVLLKHWMRFSRVRIGFTHGGLGDVYVDGARRYIEEHGGEVLTDVSVTDVDVDGDEIRHLVVEHNGQKKHFRADAYVFAMSPVDLRKTLPQGLLQREDFFGLDAFEGVPYITVNLWFDKKITDKQFWAILNDEEPRANLNTDFYDKSNIYELDHEGSFITSNIIFSHAYHHMSDEEIIEKTLAELRQTLPNMKGNLIHSHVHRLPYIIYAARPELRKYIPSYRTSVHNMYLAGDWLAKEFPQSMEAAVISGEQVARAVLRA